MGMMLRRNIKARAEKAALAASMAKAEPKKEVVEEKVVEEANNDAEWTADEINKMPYMKLKSVAKQNGVEVEDRKASEIKEELIAKLVEG